MRNRFGVCMYTRLSAFPCCGRSEISKSERGSGRSSPNLGRVAVGALESSLPLDAQRAAGLAAAAPAGMNERRRVSVFQHGWAVELRVLGQRGAMVDRAVHETGRLEPDRPRPFLRLSAPGRTFAKFGPADRAHGRYPHVDQLARLGRLGVTVSREMGLVEPTTRLLEHRPARRPWAQGNGEMVRLADIAHVERPFEAHLAVRHALAPQGLPALLLQKLERLFECARIGSVEALDEGRREIVLELGDKQAA